jgi:hypothetical protein
MNIVGSRFEHVTGHLNDARTGHLNHYPSTAFKQFTRFAFEMNLQKFQRILSIIIDENSHQFDDLLIFQHHIEAFFHISFLPR